MNFPADGPVMMKKTEKWEQSTETMYERDGVLVGDVNRTLLLKGGGYYRCDFRSTYRYVSMYLRSLLTENKELKTKLTNSKQIVNCDKNWKRMKFES